jgi:hypothetical protein
VHEASRHARAAWSIAALRREGEAACRGCHAPDVVLAPGLAPAALRVGCEACHGPGSLHVAAWSDPSGGTRGTASLRRVVPATCLACHDAARSAGFDHAQRWERIRHR